LSEGEKLADAAIELLKAADDVGQFTYISPISAWELACSRRVGEYSF
jgi:PIN domain nuclease of toxin-antitoxin system